MNSFVARRCHLVAAIFLTLAMAGVVGSALGFEHIGGYVPCKLCLAQRTPYYLAIPVGLAAVLAAGLKWPAWIARGLLVVIGLLMAYGLALGVYHSGVEWHWWAGPADCSTASTSGIVTDATNLLGALETVKPPSCDEAAVRFLGLSFAGWNVLASLALAAVAFRAAARPGAAKA